MRKEFKIINNKGNVLVINGIILLRLMDEAVHRIAEDIRSANCTEINKIKLANGIYRYYFNNSKAWILAIAQLSKYLCTNAIKKHEPSWFPCEISINSCSESVAIKTSEDGDAIVEFEKGKDYLSINKSLLALCDRKSISHSKLANAFLERLQCNDYPSHFQLSKDDIKFLDSVLVLMFGVEVSRNNATLLTGLMLLDLIQANHTYGKNLNNIFSWHNAFVSEHGYKWNDWEEKDYGGKFPMAQSSTGNGNLGGKDDPKDGSEAGRENFVYNNDKSKENNDFLLAALLQYNQRHAVPRREISLAVHWLGLINNSSILKEAETEEELTELISNLFESRIKIAFDKHSKLLETQPPQISKQNNNQEQYSKTIQQDKRKNRKGLHEFDKQIKLPNPELNFGEAVDDGGCFFDALAQSLNEAQGVEYSEKLLRQKCHDFYNANKEIVDQWNAEEKVLLTQKDEYYFVQYTATELMQDFNNRSPIWGRPYIEGVMLCSELDLPSILVVEILRDFDGKPVLGYYEATKAGYKQISDKQKIDSRLQDESLPKLAVSQKSIHFVPILSIYKSHQNVNIKGETAMIPQSSNFNNYVPQLSEINYIEQSVARNTEVFDDSSDSKNNRINKRTLSEQIQQEASLKNFKIALFYIKYKDTNCEFEKIRKINKAKHFGHFKRDPKTGKLSFGNKSTTTYHNDINCKLIPDYVKNDKDKEIYSQNREDKWIIKRVISTTEHINITNSFLNMNPQFHNACKYCLKKNINNEDKLDNQSPSINNELLKRI